jgi:diguanylate cyclase (GGDEF)-like protein
MVLPELRHTEDATTIAEKLVRALDEDFFVSGDKVRISTSLGISIYPDHAADASTLIRIADKAMYHAKQAGRNTYRFYDATMKLI